MLNKKIAIIGTSPIMNILAKELSKKNKVIVFEKSNKFGGAWSLSKFRNHLFPDKTNLIVPNYYKDSKYTKEMNYYLKNKLQLNVKQTNQKIVLSKNVRFNPTKFYKYDITKLLNKEFFKNLILKKKK